MHRSLVIIGPSGSGKSTVAGVLAARGLVAVTPTWTTRLRRDDEHTGSPNHVFVDDRVFDAVERAGGFLGTAALFGHRYGLPALVQVDGRVPTVVARVAVLDLLRSSLGDPVVVQVEAPPARLRSAVLARREGAARLRGMAEEIRLGRRAAHHVIDDDRTPDEVADAVTDLIAGRVAA